MLFQQATKSFIINYGNNSDTFLDMSVQYKTLPCLQLKCIPRKERSKEDAHGNLFLFSVLCSNKQFFKIGCSQMWGGRRRLTKDLGVGVQKTCFSSGSSILVKIPQWKKKKTPLTFSSQNLLTWSQIFKLNHVMSWKLYFNQLIVSFSFMDWAHSNFKNSTLRHLNCNFSRTPYQVNKLFLISGKHFMTL